MAKYPLTPLFNESNDAQYDVDSGYDTTNDIIVNINNNKK